jgi:prepilin-type N-terminal cleavage/methylation domain-containing protein
MKNKKGFTLLELLIVVVIIAILSIAVLFVLNPAETLRKTRDAQRFADLSALRNAVAIYLTSVSTPRLGGVATTSDIYCQTAVHTYGVNSTIFYSLPGTGGTITDTSLDGNTVTPTQSATATTTPLTDGTGWVPVNLGSMVGGSPISNLPVDPVNTISNLGALSSANGKVYRYVCNSTDMTFELDAILESQSFTVDDDRRAKDGGNNPAFYEVGTNLLLLGALDDF